MTYPVFSGATQLWPGGVAAGATDMDGLTDADTTTTVPTDGALLVWHAASSNWRPAYSTADAAGTPIVAANGSLVTVLTP